MNSNRRKKAEELKKTGLTPKQAYQATKGIIGYRKPKDERPKN